MNPFHWGHSADVDQQVTMMSVSSSKSFPEHSDASRGLTDVMWHSMHVIEAVVHFIGVLIKVATFPVWWPISQVKKLGKPNNQGKKNDQSQDPFTTDLNRPLYK